VQQKKIIKLGSGTVRAIYRKNNTTQLFSDCSFIIGQNGTNKLTLAKNYPNCHKYHIRDWNTIKNILDNELAKLS